MFTVLTGNVAKNSNIFEITDNVIDDNSIIEVYPSDESIIPVEVSVTGSTLVVTFDSKAANIIPIKIFVNNLVGEYVPPSTDTIDENVINTNTSIPLNTQKEINQAVTQSIDTLYNRCGSGELDTEADNLTDAVNEINDRIPDGELGTFLYHGVNGNVWIPIDASILNYDDNSTIYSAMGDIDELTTTSKNLVGAINEVNAKSIGGDGYIQPYDNTPVKIGKIGDKDLYAVRCVTTNVPHASWGVIGTVPSNTTITKIGGCFTGSYNGQRLVGDLYDNYGGGWNNSYQISGNNVQAYCGTNVTKIDLFIEFYYNE